MESRFVVKPPRLYADTRDSMRLVFEVSVGPPIPGAVTIQFVFIFQAQLPLDFPFSTGSTDRNRGYFWFLRFSLA
jgi:hypothetical protein